MQIRNLYGGNYLWLPHGPQQGGPQVKCKELSTVNKDVYALGSPTAKTLKNEGLVPSPHLSQTFTLNLSWVCSDVHKSKERYRVEGGEELDLGIPCPPPSWCGPQGEIPVHHRGHFD